MQNQTVSALLNIICFSDKMHTYPVLLDGHVSEVNKHVVQFTGAGCVLHCAEPAEAQLVPESNHRKTYKQLW